MSNRVKIIVITAVVTGFAVVALSIWVQKNSVGIFGHNFGPSCPAKLADYCRKWEIVSTNVTDPDDHIQIPDKFRIKATGWGSEPPIWLKAQSNLTVRWLGQSKVKLREVEIGGSVDCMVGRVMLKDSHSGKNHAWHQLSVWPSQRPTASGPVDVLNICVSKLDDGGWPNQCERLNSCVTVGSRQSHGGRAHAEN